MSPRGISVEDRAVLAVSGPGTDAAVHVVRKLVLSALMTGESLRSLHGRLAHENLDISYDRLVRAKKAIKKQWQEENKKERDVYFHQELARLAETENVLWQEYFRAGGEYTREDIVENFNGEGEISSSVVRRGKDNRLAMEWFDRILRVQTERRKIMGLDQTINFRQTTINNNPLTVKGYIGIDPSTDWPDPGQAIPDRKRTIDHYED